MPFFSSARHTLHYFAEGDPSRPSLLLLHGFLGSYQDFTPLLPTLSRHFYCIAPDLPGHGQTRTKPGSYTFPQTADALLALLKHLNISQTHLLGYSMGGRLALYLACKFPDSFVRVVVESASPGLKTAEERQRRRASDEAIAHRLQTTTLPTFLDQWYRNPLFHSLQQHPNKYESMLLRRQNNEPTELANALRGLGLGQQPSLWNALEKRVLPLLLVAGGLDTKFVAINREMIAAMRRCSARLAVIEDCGHNVHLESPDEYARTILLFLTESQHYFA